MEDRRVIKTKKAIKTAFYELFLENEIEDISITELASKANIGRKTFYLHYSSVQSIVEEEKQIYGKTLTDLFDQVNPVIGDEYLDILLNKTKSFVVDHFDYFYKIVKKDKQALVKIGMKDGIYDSVYKIIKKEYEIKDQELPFLSQFIATTIVSIITTWLTNQYDMSIDDIFKFIRDCIYKGTGLLSLKKQLLND